MRLRLAKAGLSFFVWKIDFVDISDRLMTVNGEVREDKIIEVNKQGKEVRVREYYE